MKPFEIFVQVQNGLEDIALKELERLGIKNYKRYKGGFELVGHLNIVYLLNLKGLCFSRVLIRLHKFIAKTFYDLEKEIKKVDFLPYLKKFDNLCIRVNSVTSSLYHESGIQERLHTYISKQCNKDFNLVGESDTPNTQLILLTSQHDHFILSIDSSGQHLHKRGYLSHRAIAPLRETIATAMFISVFDSDYEVICDPFCGSGTIPIEISRFFSALDSDNFRTFNFMKWDNFKEEYFKKVKNEHLQTYSTAPCIIGFDILDKNIQDAKNNFKSCKLKNNIVFETKNFFDIKKEFFSEYKKALIITNPPWGKRIFNTDFKMILNKLNSFNNKPDIVLIIPDNFLKNIRRYKTLFSIESGSIIVSAIKIIDF